MRYLSRQGAPTPCYRCPKALLLHPTIERSVANLPALKKSGLKCEKVLRRAIVCLLTYFEVRATGQLPSWADAIVRRNLGIVDPILRRAELANSVTAGNERLKQFLSSILSKS